MKEIPKGRLYSFDPSDPDILHGSPGSAVREFAFGDDENCGCETFAEYAKRRAPLTLHVYQRQSPAPSTAGYIAKTIALRTMDTIEDEFAAEWCTEQDCADWSPFDPVVAGMARRVIASAIEWLLLTGKAYDCERVGSVVLDAETIEALLSEPETTT